MTVYIKVDHPDGEVTVEESYPVTLTDNFFEDELSKAVARAAHAMESYARVVTEYHPDAASVLEEALVGETDHKVIRKLQAAISVLDPEGLRHEP